MIFYFGFVENIEAIIKDLHTEAADLLKQNNNDEFIISSLVKRGVDRHYAEMILDNVKSDKSDKKEFYRHLFGGSFVLVAGIILTFGTYSLAVPGGLYLVFWGFMVYGVIEISRALILFKK